MIQDTVHKDRTRALIVLTAIVLGLIIYGRTLGLPLYLDDAPQFRWLASISIPQIWYTFQIASFYRPVPFTAFKLLWILQGGYNAPTLHALAVMLHIANGIMIGLLARRLTSNPWAGPIAAALLITFPFAYQAVPWVTSIFHVALLTGVLGTILLGLRFLESGSCLALIGAWITAFLAIFSHENGVMLPPLAGLVLLAICINERSVRTGWRRLAWLLIPTAGTVGLYFYAWVTVPKKNDFSHGIQWTAFDAKVGYVAQSLIYPFSALIRPLVSGSAAIIPVIAALTVIAVVVVFGSILWASRALPNKSLISAALIAPLVGLLWLIISAIPATLLLTTNYLLGSPRLVYLCSAGVALFWSGWLAGVAQNRISRTLVAFVLIGFVALGTVFGLERVDAHVRMGNFYQQFDDDLKTQPDVPIVLVNAPSYIAPPTEKTTFLMGAEGATFLAYYVSLQDLVWVNTAHDYPVKSAGFDNTLAQNPWEIFRASDPWLDWQQLDQFLNSAQAVYTVSLSKTEFHPVRVGDKLTTLPIGKPLADFGDVVLWSASVKQTPGDFYPMLALDWEARKPLAATPFVHVFCDGALASQADGPPLGGLHPFDRWQPGERWTDRRELHKVCPIEVGLYDAATGERYKAQLADGSTTDSVHVRLN